MKNLDYNNATTWEKLKFSLRSWRYIGVGKSLLIWFLAISLIPLAVISFINFLNAYHGLTIVAEKSLNTTSQLRVEYINTFFNEVIEFLETNSKHRGDQQLLKELSLGYQRYKNDPEQYVQTEEYQNLIQSHKDEFKNLIHKLGYYDIYYIGEQGNILFSMRNEADVGSNLFTGPYKQTRFAATVRNTLEQKKLYFSDLEFYEPSFEKLSGFFVQPVIDESGGLIGMIALQITMDRINQIIRQDAGYGETGQAFIVGSDRLLRSAMRFGDVSDILHTKLDNQKVKDWLFFLQNRTNLSLLKEKELEEEKVSTYDSDLNGKYVLGIYRNLNLVEQLGVNWALVEEIEHNEAFAYAKMLSDIVKLTFIITIIVVFFTSILVTRWFVNPIKQLSSWAKEVADGLLDTKQIKAPNNEIGEMVDTFNRLLNALQEYANVARLMAKGDYSEKVRIRSEGDTLGKSMNQMVESFKQVVDQANRIAEGDYSVNVIPRSEKDTLNLALFEMTKTLNQNAIYTANQDWLKSGINLLDKQMSDSSSLKDLSEKIIHFITPYVQAQLGYIYYADQPSETLTIMACYGHRKPKQDKVLSFSDGLAGQVASSKQPMIIKQVEGNELIIKTGSSMINASTIILMPLMHETELVGVVELVTTQPDNELTMDFLKLANVNIAIAMKTMLAAEKVKQLLTHTQEQANELSVQQEELRQANEELQQQTIALRTSEENLQAQKEELKVTNEELEERTKALEEQRDAINEKNKELEIARKEIEQKAKDLEQASRYKSEFLANMSHELRTPLNSILVLSQLLAENKKQHLDEKELEYAKTINSSGTDLIELINEILDLNKVESGKIDLYIESMYLDDVSSFVQKNFGTMAERKGLELAVTTSKLLPLSIKTDSKRLYQILKNLLSNAIKFTHNGSVRLNIYRPDASLIPDSFVIPPEEAIAFSVIDTGIGIPHDKLQLIFEAFRQADGTTSRKYGGTGLGLSISKAFAELLGGALHVESQEGKGTSFTLILPQNYIERFGNDELTEPNPPSQEEIDLTEDTNISQAETSTTIPSPDTVTIAIDDRGELYPNDKLLLIIEDDVDFASLLLDLAHDYQFKGLIAYDGESGLHYADFYQPHAVLLDIGLPGIDGYQVIERLKQSKRTRHIPVHIISAADKSMEAMKKGAIGYLRKPVSRETLEEAFTRIEDVLAAKIRNLLVVEDDEITRKSICNLLQIEGVEIVAVANAEAAVEHLSKSKFDCLILDLGLEGMSGYELLDWIKLEKKIENLPVIIYTSQDLSEKDTMKLQRYADSIILKGARSFERLLSETILFLHQVESKLPPSKQEMLKKIHTREDILSGKKILIVDDDMRNVFALASLLESYEMKVIIARNGKDGLQKLSENNDVDLILMDIMMPEMDGYEAIREIRKDPTHTQLPIIALTAKAMKDDREKCIAAGANEYLTKPFDNDKLVSMLRVWLYR